MSDSSIAPPDFASTYLNNITHSYGDVVYRVKSLLGAPVTPIELTDAQWANIISEAIEKWTQFGGGMKEEYLAFCSNVYTHQCGVRLDTLLNVGCNQQHCYQTVVYESVTSTDVSCEHLGTSTGYLSVSPFKYPDSYNYLDPYSMPFTGTSGQNVYLYFDPKNPWNINNVCNADCVSINPLSSSWFLLSSNPALSGKIFDFVNDPELVTIAPEISAYIGSYDLSAVPLTALGSQLSAISPCYYDLSAFYPADLFFSPPVEACVDIGGGSGYIFPNCDTTLISSCGPLTGQYNISPSWAYVLTSITLSSVSIETSATDFSEISSFFQSYCDECNCACQFLSSYNETLSSFNFDIVRDVISGANGVLYPLSAMDMSQATHVRLNNIPTCTLDGSIPLNSNDGILATFTLCNTALNTNGRMYMESVQFYKDFKPPAEILCEDSCTSCGWQNNGFTLTNHISAYDACVRTTPTKVKVDLSFSKKTITTNVGTVSSYLSGNIDPVFSRPRKVLGVFSVDNSSQYGGGGLGGDLLFNFDYALMAATMGYNMQGGRTMMAGRGYDLLTYHMAKSFVEQSRKMLRYVTYTFDPKTQYLKVMPEPLWQTMGNGNEDCNGCGTSSSGYGAGLQCYLLGVYVEPSIEDCLSETWVQDWVLARAMWTLGRIRGAFGSVTMFGGVTITGDQLLQEGTVMMEKLLKELRQDNMWVQPPSFFIG